MQHPEADIKILCIWTGIVNLTRVWQTDVMKTKTPSYQRHRFPSEIISHAVWLYHRFCLSFREVEELLAERGITVSLNVPLWLFQGHHRTILQSVPSVHEFP